ncbi:MAG: nitroreductase family protein [Clostridiaceae bacterium]|nr:nitroreductase family protein [Clostridiaceae bacterium]
MERSYETAKAVMAGMRERYSCRSFTDRPIDDELLRDLIGTGLCAPTGGNLQPYSIITVRKRETKDVLAKVCGQAFIAKADVDIVFLLDWSNIKRFALNQESPFVAGDSFSHNLIAFADIVCAAQMMETAAFMAGIGTCMVGNILGSGDVLKPLLKLPYNSYPVLMLAMGYPAAKSNEHMRKAGYEAMVFSEAYPEDTAASDLGMTEKYEGMTVTLPKNEAYAARWLSSIKEALLTTYTKERTEEIIEEIKAEGRINEMQRRFCLKYAAHKSVGESEKIREDMRRYGINM